MKTIKKYQCPICGNYTLDAKNECDICDVCFWEDDGSEEYPDEDFGPNHISFNDAKKSWNEKGCIKESVRKFTRRPLGIELPKDSKEYEDIKKYIDDAEDSYLLAVQPLIFETSYRSNNEPEHLEAKHKAFEIFNALAFLDEKVGQKAAANLALCYASGYGCRKNLSRAHFILEEIENIYSTRLKDVTVQRSNDKDTITIKLCDKTNDNYLKVICNVLLHKLDAEKYGIIKCDINDSNGILIEAECYQYYDDDLVNDIEKAFIDFINIETVIVDPKAFTNPHEGIAYFNGAKSILKKYLYYN